MSMFEHLEFSRELCIWGDLLPPDASAAVATWTAASNLSFDDPVTALRAAVQDGTLTADTIAAAMAEVATTLAATERARSLVAELHHPLGARFATAVFAHADEILNGLRPHFADAATIVRDAAQTLPETATAEAVVAGGAGMVDAWHALTQATVALDSIASIRIKLATMYGHSLPTPVVAGFVGPVTDSKDLTKADYLWTGREAGVGGVAWLDPNAPGHKWAALARRGYQLRLNNQVDSRRVATLRPLDPEPAAA